MTACEGHAHPCLTLATAASKYGVLGTVLMLGMLADIGDHADDDEGRMVVRLAFEAVAKELPAAVSAASGGAQ